MDKNKKEEIIYNAMKTAIEENLLIEIHAFDDISKIKESYNYNKEDGLLFDEIYFKYTNDFDSLTEEEKKVYIETEAKICEEGLNKNFEKYKKPEILRIQNLLDKNIITSEEADNLNKKIDLRLKAENTYPTDKIEEKREDLEIKITIDNVANVKKS